jgi:hypothetical protein
MSYFALAVVGLLAAEGLMGAGYGFPGAPVRAPETLVLVHVVSIGWLSLLMCGALFQFVPVLVARPLFSNVLPLPALLCLTGGLAALLCGFLQLGGHLEPGPSLLPVAGFLLGSGFALVLWDLGRTLWAARPLPLPARFVVVGLLSLAATAAIGIVFALALGGAVRQPHLLDLAASGLPVHVVAGFGGWLTFTAMGVSYRLLAMFMLSPEPEGWRTRAVLHLGTAALVLAIGGGLGSICLGVRSTPALLAASLPGLFAFVLYGWDIVHLYHNRRRRSLKLNSRMAAFALASLGLAVLATAGTLALGSLPRHAGAVVFLLAFGWLSGLGLAQLYKIIPFLTWLETYGPVLGRTPTPRVQDLVVEARAARWFHLYFAAVWTGAAALFAGHAGLFRGAAFAMLVATAGIAVELVRARRLADVDARRHPEGVRTPRLLFSLSRET